jgi:hypothetical protein
VFLVPLLVFRGFDSHDTSFFGSVSRRDCHDTRLSWLRLSAWWAYSRVLVERPEAWRHFEEKISAVNLFLLQRPRCVGIVRA